mmetsp:Transcript_49061/g.106258  ORF Transcript_49061/g.106258 Transcript_49061/m.106258 type:complete len:245 (-) Transcript_49061:306-1040(-)
MLSRRSGPSALMQKRRRTATSKLRRRNSCVLLLNRLANIATRWRRRRSGEGSTAGTCSTTRRNTATTRSSFVALATLGGSATPKLTTPTLIRSPTERRGRSNRPACRRWSTTCTRLRCAAPSGLADARLTRRATSRTSTSATRFTTRRSSALLTRTRRRSRLTSSAARPCETRRLCVRACSCVCARVVVVVCMSRRGCARGCASACGSIRPQFSACVLLPAVALVRNPLLAILAIACQSERDTG